MASGALAEAAQRYAREPRVERVQENERPTAHVDVRAVLASQFEQPSLGKPEEDVRGELAPQVELPCLGKAHGETSTDDPDLSEVHAAPAEPTTLRAMQRPRVRVERPFRAAARCDTGKVDVARILDHKLGRKIALMVAATLALLLAGASFSRPRTGPSVAVIAGGLFALAKKTVAAPSLLATSAKTPSERPATRPGVPTAAMPSPRATTPSAPPAAVPSATSAQPSKRLARPADPISEPAERRERGRGRRVVEPPSPEPEKTLPGAALDESASRGAATPERAARLYIGGKYREALAEYRLLAEAHPEQRVYTELARILRHKIIDTCVRTQPYRSEQCREL